MSSNHPDNEHLYPYVPTIVASGLPYTIGYTHGSEAKKHIFNNVNTYTSFFKETADISWHEAKERSKLFLPAIKKLYPEILEEVQGIADGAGLDKLDILALNIRSEIALTNYTDDDEDVAFPQASSSDRAPPSITDGCTGFAQKSADSSTLVVAQNWDWLEQLHGGIVFMDVTASNGVRFKFLNEAGLVGKMGMNSHGLAVCINAIRSGAKRIDRLPMHIMIRRLLEFSKNVDEALAALEELGGACSSNFLLGDKSGCFIDVELTPRGMSVIRPREAGAVLSSPPMHPLVNTSPNRHTRGNGDRFVAHTNHLISPPSVFKGGPVRDHPAPNSFARLRRVVALIETAISHDTTLTLESAAELLKDQQGLPYSICRDRPPGAIGMEQMTTLASVVMQFKVGSGPETAIRACATIGRPCLNKLQKIEFSV